MRTRVQQLDMKQTDISLETKIIDNAIIYDKLRVVSFKFEVTMQEKRSTCWVRFMNLHSKFENVASDSHVPKTSFKS